MDKKLAKIEWNCGRKMGEKAVQKIVEKVWREINRKKKG